MKTLLLSLLFAAAASAAADAPSIAGKWQVHTSISGNESDAVCTFAQKDDALTGNCASDRGTFEITGKINGTKVTWSYKSDYNGTPLTVKYDGAVDAAAGMKGSVAVPEFNVDGNFTATRPSSNPKPDSVANLLALMSREGPISALLILVAAGPLCALDPSLRISQYHKEYWAVEQGLPHSYVTAIAQDVDGYLLVGTDEGLARFDGLNFRPFPSDASLRLARTWISALLIAGDSSLWLGTFDGVLVQLRHGKVLAHYQADGSVFDLREDAKGALWVSTRTGVLRLENGALHRVPELGPPLDTSWNVLSRDTGGRLWIVTASGLFRESAGAITQRLSNRGPGQILSVLARRNGGLLLGTTRGLFRLSPESGEPVAVSGVDGPVVSLLEDRDGMVWAGSWGQGLFRLTERGADRWTTRDGLAEDFIRTLAEDAEGNLWIGSSGGLGQWKDSRIIPLGQPEGHGGQFRFHHRRR